jgi:hypothetical protein
MNVPRDVDAVMVGLRESHRVKPGAQAWEWCLFDPSTLIEYPPAIKGTLECLEDQKQRDHKEGDFVLVRITIEGYVYWGIVFNGVVQSLISDEDPIAIYPAEFWRLDQISV